MKNRNMVKALERQIKRAKEEFATEFHVRWGMRTPVLTGTLLSGNDIKITDTQFIFDNEVPYFGYIEHGTPTHAPVGMLKTTLSEVDEIWALSMKRAKK